MSKSPTTRETTHMRAGHAHKEHGEPHRQHAAHAERRVVQHHHRPHQRPDPLGRIESRLWELFGRPPLSPPVLRPIKVNVAEGEKAYRVKAEVPGVKKEDIHVTVDGNQVSIDAEVKKSEEEKAHRELRSERYYGKQFRTFTLAHEIDSAKAQARYQNGILELRLPKKAGAGSTKEIRIQ